MTEEILKAPQSINWPKIILAAVFAFALLAASAYAGYWYGINSKGKSQMSKVETTTPTTTPTPTPTPEAISTPTPSEPIEAPEGWETYINEKYSYKMQYPPEARIDEERDEYFAVYLGEKGTLVGSYATLNVQVADNPKGLSRRYFLADWLREDPENVLANVKIDDAVIGGVNALRIVLDGGWWQGTSAKTVYVVPRGSKMYLIWNDQYWGGRKEPNAVFELNKGTFFSEIETMLSTFTFLD